MVATRRGRSSASANSAATRAPPPPSGKRGPRRGLRSQTPASTTKAAARAPKQPAKRTKAAEVADGNEERAVRGGEEEEDDEEDHGDLATARPKVGAKVQIKQKAEPNTAKRAKGNTPGRARAKWVGGEVIRVNARSETVTIKLDDGKGTTLVRESWVSKTVRFDDGHEPQRPDLDKLDDKIVLLGDALDTWVSLSDSKRLQRVFNCWVQYIGQALPQKNTAASKAVSKSGKAKTAGRQAGGRAVKRKHRPSKGRTGIRNLGNTCYVSSIVQSLAAIPQFRNLFLELDKYLRHAGGSDGTLVRTKTVALVDELSRRPGRREMSAAASSSSTTDRALPLSLPLSELVRVLWTGKLMVATPHKLLAAVYQLQPRFAGYEQQDAQDFLYFVLEQTLEELQEELTPEKTVEFKSLFGGEFKSTLKCKHCEWCSSSSEAFMDMSLDFPPKTGKSNVARTLNECLAHFVTPEPIEDFKCEKCRRADVEKQISVEKLPRVLVLHLKRWRTSMKVAKDGTVSIVRQKDSSKITYSERLDMAPYSAAAVMDGAGGGAAAAAAKGGGRRGRAATAVVPMELEVPTSYRLRAAVVHHGSGLGTGHYTAFARPGVAQTATTPNGSIDAGDEEMATEWVEYDDMECRRPVLAETVLKSNAYLLLYEREGAWDDDAAPPASAPSTPLVGEPNYEHVVVDHRTTRSRGGADPLSL